MMKQSGRAILDGREPWTSPKWSTVIKQLPSIVKLELILHKRTPVFDFGPGDFHVIDSSFPIVNGLNDTQLREMVVWHGVETMGKDYMLEFSPCSPAFKVALTRDRGSDIWRIKQTGPDGFADRVELEDRGWKIISRIMEM